MSPRRNCRNCDPEYHAHNQDEVEPGKGFCLGSFVLGNLACGVILLAGYLTMGAVILCLEWLFG